MGDKSNIAWTDSTVNFWSGCTKVSAGCQHCYAETRDKRMMIEKVIHWGKGAPRLKSNGAVKDALAFNQKPWICDHCGEPSKDKESCLNRDCQSNIAEFTQPSFHRRRIFSLSLGDWLDEEVPIEWLAEMLNTIRQCDQVTWILCTKRPENWEKRLREVIVSMQGDGGEHLKNPLWHYLDKWIPWNGVHRYDPPKNIILLASVENQAAADLRIPQLLKIPAVCRGLSLEPLLGPVDLKFWYDEEEEKYLPFSACGNAEEPTNALHWLIIGGESGPGARACNVDWIRSLVKQGKAAGVATFVKQLGAEPRCERSAMARREFPNDDADPYLKPIAGYCHYSGRRIFNRGLRG